VKGTEMKRYRQMGQQSFTQPCGTPLPPGAICTCNCISGSLMFNKSETVCICDTISVPAGKAIPAGTVCVCNTISVGSAKPLPAGHQRNMSGTVCSCDTICTCNTVCSCVSACSCVAYTSNKVCTCNTVCSCVGTHYWHPN